MNDDDGSHPNLVSSNFLQYAMKNVLVCNESMADARTCEGEQHKRHVTYDPKLVRDNSSSKNVWLL
jgi:hypothetical protein